MTRKIPNKLKNKHAKPPAKSVRVKADEGIKALFNNLSIKPRIDLLNGLFQEQFSAEECEITPIDPQFIDEHLERIVADYVVQVKHSGETKKFHVEFQTQNHATMIIRMFDYGFKIAKDSATKTRAAELTLEFPRQLVLYLERNDDIVEELMCKIVIPDSDQTIAYKVPVLKYWEIEPSKLRNQLYALLPFQVFGSRKKIKDILDDKGLAADQRKVLVYEELHHVLLTVQHCGEEMRHKLVEKKIDHNDFVTMSQVMASLNHHLYEKFEMYYAGFNQEVQKMIKDLIDPTLIEKGKIEGKIEALIETILDTLSEKGNVSDDLADKVRSINDYGKLRVLSALSRRVKTVDDFVKRIP